MKGFDREVLELIMSAIFPLKMKNLVVLMTLVCIFLAMGMLSLAVVSTPEAWGAGVPVTQIFHQQVISFLEGSSLPLEVDVNDPAGVTGVRCYFRFDSSVPFIYSEMAPGKNNIFTTQLPVAISTVQKIEYLFLVVNGQKQAILSPTFTLNKNNTSKRSATGVQNVAAEHYQLKSEVDGADTVNNFFLQPANIQISLVPQQNRYGMLAGLYSREQLRSEVVAGYFGAFRLDPRNNIAAVKGSIVIGRSGELSLSREKNTVTKETVDIEQVSVPQITGSSWTGLFWRSNDYANTVQPVTATVTQNADGRVTITTSLTGLGHSFSGEIYDGGHLLLYDAYDDEDWSTQDGPVTDLYIKIEDYVIPSTDECKLPDECKRPDECLDPDIVPSPDICNTPLPDICNAPLPDECVNWPLNIIELKRSTNEKVPIGALYLLKSSDVGE